MASWFKNPIAAQKREDGSFDPSPLTLLFGTSSKSPYAAVPLDKKYTGSKPILVVGTDQALMTMENEQKFNTGNHPVEMLVPMLHFQDAGFEFEFATVSGSKFCLEMWAFPNKDETVKAFYDKMLPKMNDPKKLDDISSIDGYSAIFIPGGHGCMINLPASEALGKLLHLAHNAKMPTVTLCHGPAALLSTTKGENAEFCYKGYKAMCFTDKTDAFTPKIGYLPGNMPWKCQERLEEAGLEIVNKGETGSATHHEELITGDSPKAAQNLGVLAAPLLVEYAMIHKA